MSRRNLILTITLVLAVLGALASGMLAARRQSSVVATEKVLMSSMLNPGNLLAGPRTYNQTLAEAVDTAGTVTQLRTAGYPVNSLQLDVLPDSFNIQGTLSLDSSISTTQQQELGAVLTGALLSQSNTLSGQLFTPAPDARVTLTRVLPVETNYTQRPTSAALLGALAGALLGLFVGLALTDRRTA